MLRAHALILLLAAGPAAAAPVPVPMPVPVPVPAPAPAPAPKAKATKATKPEKAATASKPREAIEKLLKATERPPGPAELAAIGPGAEDTLVAVAADKAVEPALRGRATAALAHAASPRARAFLIEVVTRGAPVPPAEGGAAPAATPAPAPAAPAEILVLRRAAVALGWQGGPGAPAPLGRLLAHPDPEVRTDAAVGLGLTRLAPAAALLRNHLPVEKDPRVRAHVARQLRTIETALGLADAERPPPPAEAEAAPAPAEAATDLPRTGTRKRTPPPPPPSRLQPNRNRF